VAHEFTHLDDRGNAHMVDVTGKAPTHRRAEARCHVSLAPDALGRLVHDGPGGAIFEAARMAGILAAKRTPTLIPLCHPLLLGDIRLTLRVETGSVVVTATVETFGPTGVEMEALTACAIAALTVVHAHRHTEPKPVVDGLSVWEKSGGRSGTWLRGGVQGTGSAASALSESLTVNP
jgi:cyclic pyranopterin phosphate synthase